MNFGIIAAGEGSRLASEGVRTPKPLLPVGGVPMIERLVRIFEANGAESINIVVNGFMREVQDYLREMKVRPGIELTVSVKTTPSSMHTFYELSKMLRGKGRFIATTVDTIFREEDFKGYVDAFSNAPESVGGMMAVTDFIEDEKPLYVDVAPDMSITAFRDKSGIRDKYISGGIYGLDSRSFSILDKCMEEGVSRMRNFQRALLDRGLKLEAYPMGKIIDVDHASDIERAVELLAEK